MWLIEVTMVATRLGLGNVLIGISGRAAQVGFDEGVQVAI
jgi:hypothetical protein